MAADIEGNNLFLNLNAAGVLEDEDLFLLLDANRPRRNLHLEQPYWQYQPFELERMEDHKCEVELRFSKEEIYTLAETFELPDRIKCYNGTVVNSVEALCICLKRFAYPCRYVDLIPRFARPVPHLCMVSNLVTDMIFDRFHNLLTNLDQPWLSPANLQAFADAIRNKGAALENCWGFVDGTVRPICRPGRNQRVVYNGHKRVHALKFQSVVAPNGLIANLYGPVEGKRHDSALLAMSGLLPQLEQYSFSPTRQALCIYGDPAYPHRLHLQCPYERRAPLTEQQQAFNRSMSQVRVSVEWVFGDIVNYFKFTDFKKNLKIGLSSVGKIYSVCALLRNALTCLRGSITSEYFNVQPPALNEYFL
eukprot:gene1370-biopygen1120